MKKEIKKIVKESYNTCASLCFSPYCCSPYTIYPHENIKNFPANVLRLSSGCGNPIAMSDLKEGEIVLDIGCGGGLDTFLASSFVGKKGLVIGLDMAREMINKAMESAQELNISNVEFRLGEAENIPLDDNFVDVVISNCVIVTILNKKKALSEILRVLKPKGRFITSDIVSDGQLSDSLKNNPELWVKCFGGAIPKEDYINLIRDVGFKDVSILKERRFKFQDERFYTVIIRGYKY